MYKLAFGTSLVLRAKAFITALPSRTSHLSETGARMAVCNHELICGGILWHVRAERGAICIDRAGMVGYWPTIVTGYGMCVESLLEKSRE